MNAVTNLKDYFGVMSEFMAYIAQRKSYWLAPVLFVLLMLGSLAFFLEGSTLAPAIYSVF